MERTNYLRNGALIAAVYNVNRDPKKSRALGPADIYPFLKEALSDDDSQRMSIKEAKNAMAGMFTLKKKGS